MGGEEHVFATVTSDTQFRETQNLSMLLPSLMNGGQNPLKIAIPVQWCLVECGGTKTHALHARPSGAEWLQRAHRMRAEAESDWNKSTTDMSHLRGLLSCAQCRQRGSRVAGGHPRNCSTNTAVRDIHSSQGTQSFPDHSADVHHSEQITAAIHPIDQMTTAVDGEDRE